MVLYHNSFDSCILIDYIYDNPNRNLFEDFLEINEEINKKNICKSCLLIYKHTFDEVSSVIRTQLGYILSEINKKLNEIVPEKTSIIDFTQKRKILEFMNGLETFYPKYQEIIRFIKASFFEDDIEYISLINIETRREKLADMLSLKNRFNVNYVASFFGKNFRYYDATEDIRDDFLKKEFEDKAAIVFRGARKNRNYYDYILLYYSFTYSHKFKEFILHFITKDKIMLRSRELFQNYFKIMELHELIGKLKQLII